jgi:hypothetical protein
VWVDYVTACGVVAASLAAVMAYRQLNESKKAARGQLMFAIDQALAPFEDVRRGIKQWRGGRRG